MAFSSSYSSYSCTQASKDLDFVHCCKTSILNSEGLAQSKSLASPAKGLYLILSKHKINKILQSNEYRKRNEQNLIIKSFR